MRSFSSLQHILDLILEIFCMIQVLISRAEFDRTDYVSRNTSEFHSSARRVGHPLDCRFLITKN